MLFRSQGFSPLPVVNLQREVETGQIARFRVVRPAPETMPEGRIQFVQHLTAEAIWQPRHLRHANGVVKLACLFVVAEDPVDTAARWAHFAALLPRPAGAFVYLRTARGGILIGRRESWGGLLGDAPPAPALAGYALECRDGAALFSRCELLDRKSTRLNSSHIQKSRMPSSA